MYITGACPFSCKSRAGVVLMRCHQVALQVHFAFSLPQLLSPEGTGSEQKNHVLLLLHFREKTRLVNKKIDNYLQAQFQATPPPSKVTSSNQQSCHRSVSSIWDRNDVIAHCNDKLRVYKAGHGCLVRGALWLPCSSAAFWGGFCSTNLVVLICTVCSRCNLCGDNVQSQCLFW